MKEIIVTNQKELDAAVKLTDVLIIIQNTTEIVEICGNSTVRAYDNSTVTAYGNSTVRAYGNSVSIEAFMLAVVIMIGCVCKIKTRNKSVTVIKNKIATYTKKDFINIYGADADGNVTLYKSVNPETGCDFYTGKIKYKGVVTCPDWNSDNTIECGEGLHLSPLPELALSYNQGKLLKCKVHKNDFVVYAENISKVRCKKVTVIGEYKANAK